MDTKKQLEVAARVVAPEGPHRPYEVTIPGVLSIKADGPDEHQRAMEALDKMQAVIPGLPDLGRAKAQPLGPMLHASIATFLKQIAAAERAPATLLETEHTLSLFRDLIDDLPMAELGSAQTDVFREAMTHWPARARVLPQYKGLSARKIIALSRKAGGGGLAVRTMEKHIDRLRVFFNWAVKRRELPHNPLTGVRLQTTADKYTQSRRAIAPSELGKLFDPHRRASLCADDPMYFWLPLFGLLTGARLKEMAQLQVSDVDQVGGIWGMHITPGGRKSVKNSQSRRFVPLPERLLAVGLLDYLRDVKEQGFCDLFPGGSVKAKNGPGDRAGKWFNRTYLRVSAGIWDPQVTFHSTRHSFLTAGDRLGFTEAQVGVLTGHAAKSVQARHYIDAATVPERKERIDRIAGSYDLPELVLYRAGQFEEYFADLRRTERAAQAATDRKARAGRKGRRGNVGLA